MTRERRSSTSADLAKILESCTISSTLRGGHAVMMSEAELHHFLVLIEFAFATLNFALLPRISAPYGRHFRTGWGWTVDGKWGWLMMEIPTVVLFVPLYWAGSRALEAAPLVLLVLFQSHYIYRTFVYPFRLRGKGRSFALLIVSFGFMFGTLNSYLIARHLSEFGHYPQDWLSDPRFLLGSAMFLLGTWLNRHSDAILRGLRSGPDLDYQIPKGGGFRWVSCPNYLGELVQWFGFALASWSLAGLAFAIYTLSNLGPRAVEHHRWYQKNFRNYPQQRWALIPFVL